MNVLVDLRSLQSGVISGVEVSVKNLVERLCAEFPEVRFVLWTNSRKKLPKNFPVFDTPNAVRVETRISNLVFLASSFLFRLPRVDKLVARKLRKKGIFSRREKFDVVFVPDPRPTPVSDDVHKITLFHDLSPFHFRKTFSLKTRIWHLLSRFVTEASESSKILTPSRCTKNDVCAHFQMSEDQVCVVGGSASDRMRPIHDEAEREHVRQKYGLPSQFLLTLSTLEPRKNLPNLVEAFAKFQAKHKASDFFLVIAGKANRDIFQKVSFPEKSFVLFPGFIDEEDKAAVFSLAMGFVYPSLFEGFGIPVLEAMKCGTPVLCSDRASLPEVYGDAAVSFDPSSTAEMARSIGALYCHEDLRDELTRKGMERAQMPQFAWKTIAQKTMAVFTQVVDQDN